jgi:hypothetical protein
MHVYAEVININFSGLKQKTWSTENVNSLNVILRRFIAFR